MASNRVNRLLILRGAPATDPAIAAAVPKFSSGWNSELAGYSEVGSRITVWEFSTVRECTAAREFCYGLQYERGQSLDGII